MNHTKETKSFAYSLVTNYAKFDALSDCYTLNINNISDFDIHELSAKIMSEDESYASEATGPDNPSFTNKMLPALTRFLSKSYDRDEEIEFAREWRDGVCKYFSSSANALLEAMLNDYNQDEGYTNKEDSSSSRYSEEGKSIWAV